MKKENCKYCYGEGYSSRIYDEIGSEGLGGGESYKIKRQIGIKFCGKCDIGINLIKNLNHSTLQELKIKILSKTK